MSSSSFSGFSEEEVNASLNKLQSSYDSLYEQLCTKMQTDFIDTVAQTWACNEAQKFFASVEEALNIILVKTTQTYVNVTSTIATAARTWANQTRTSYTPVQFAPASQKVNSTSVQENIDGYRGADQNALNDAIATLKKINAQVDSCLDQSVKAVERSGFQDAQGSQQGALTTSLNSVKSKIDSVFTEIINVFTKAINQTISNYGGIISKNSIDFSKIANSQSGAANGQFIPRENVLDDYWQDDENNKLKAVVNDDGTTTIYQLTEDGREVPMGVTVLSSDESAEFTVGTPNFDDEVTSTGTAAVTGTAEFVTSTVTGAVAGTMGMFGGGSSSSNSGQTSTSSSSSNTTTSASSAPAAAEESDPYAHGWGEKYGETWSSWWNDVSEAYSDTHGFFSAIGNTAEAILDTGGAVVETAANFVSDVAHGIGNVIGWLFG